MSGPGDKDHLLFQVIKDMLFLKSFHATILQNDAE
jgi:hypothetical protein